MSPHTAELVVKLWYLFALGGVRCWAELRFVAGFSGKQAGRVPCVAYTLASRLPAALFVWLQMPDMGNLILTAVLCLFAVHMLKLQPRQSVFSCTIVFVINTFYDGFLDALMQPISSTLQLPGLFASVVVQLILSVLLLFLLLSGFRLIVMRFGLAGHNPPTASLIATLPCALLVLAVRSMVDSGARGDRQAILWMGVSVVAFGAILFAHHRTALLITSRQENRFLERESRMQAQQAKEALRRWEDASAYQHDVRNHLLVVSGLLKKEHSADARSYLDTLISASDRLSPSLRTGDAALDILLEEKVQYARREGIAISVDFQVPISVSIDSVDLCVLFANGLDNAIRACLQVPADQRKIAVTVKRRHEFLLVLIENHMIADPGPVVYGTGLHNAQKVAYKYGGSMQAEKQGDKFYFSAILCL